MLPLISNDPVDGARSAIRYLLSLKPENETVADFLLRHIDYERRNYLPAPIVEPPAPPAPRRRKAPKTITRTTVTGRIVTEPTTTKWPPNQGEYYVGAWPPAFITPRGGRCARTKPIF